MVSLIGNKSIYGNKYTGMLDANNIAYGQGTIEYSNGATYAGTWAEDKFHGWGIITSNGRKEGEFRNNQWSGKSTAY